MSQTNLNASITDMTYSPPPLPDYLSRNHTLNVIVGVPTDEEVKAIHDAIRAVNIPALYDHKLSTRLTQYLFTVQMAVYRNEYSSGIFPGENTYTPPSIPSHIPISLEPIVGAPTDNELESAHGAVRTLEGLAHSPFFDATLSAKLSQHFFNIQFARYIQDANQGYFTQRPMNPAPPLQLDENDPSVVTLGRQPEPVDQQVPQDNPSNTSTWNVASTAQATQPIHIQSEPAFISRLDDKLERLCAAQQERNQLLQGNQDVLKMIQRTLSSHHIAAKRAQNYDHHCAYATMNETGDLPWMHGLASVYAESSSTLSRALTAQELAQYLKFYDMGSSLIEEGTGNLQPGKEKDATGILASYLCYGSRPVSQAA